ncbi:MAG TPA: flagellar biosynthesis protein FlhF [Burkholderiales bacterium]|jgi:flagellar biosynthesis protein FlhF|nr:flagellar biosynthesis protein FlhF [Burkholderiales bacterium]
MLMKKFVAPTSREAMQKMKNELGPDALVISNRKVAAGVEILAMVENAVEALEPQPEPVPARLPQPAAQPARAAGPQGRPAAAMRAPEPPARPHPSMANPFAAPGFASAGSPATPFAAAPPAPRGEPRAEQRLLQRPAFRAPARSVAAAPVAPSYQTLKDFAAHLDQAEVPEAPAAPAARQPARVRSDNPFAGMPAVRAMRRAPGKAAPAPTAAPVAAPAAPRPAAAPAVAPVAPVTAAAAPAPSRPMPSLATPSNGNEQRLLDEVKAMKAMLQSQLQGFAFRDMSQRRPLAMKFWREMSDAGFSATVTRTVVDKLPDDLSEAQSRKWLGEVLSRNLHCADSSRDLVEAGGTYALVGPTGVGKTTTIAKLAARCVVKYGAQSLGLITTDSYRIGAFDQLAIYGKILGVKVHSAQSLPELEAALSTLRGKRLILIDTTGMGQRDSRLAEQINLLDLPQVQRILLLNAAAQAETLDDVARAYQGRAAGARPLSGAIFSKIDEAAKLGPVLDTAMRHTLNVYYVSNGQRVPEDLHPAKAQALIHRSLKSAADSVFALRDDEVPLRAISQPAHA